MGAGGKECWAMVGKDVNGGTGGNGRQRMATVGMGGMASNGG